MYKQDPSVLDFPPLPILLPHRVGSGPSDENFKCIPTELVGRVPSPSTAGDFDAITPATSPLQHDLVQVYAAARLTLDCVLRALSASNPRLSNRWRWHWDKDVLPGAPMTPLTLIAHAGEKANAVYVRSKKCLKLYFVTPTDDRTGPFFLFCFFCFFC
jgi:hypothetical protein